MTTWTQKTESAGGFSASSLTIFLLMEDGGFLLQQDGKKLLVEISLVPAWTLSSATSASWTEQVPS